MAIKMKKSKAVAMMPDRSLEYPFLYRLSAEK